MNNMRLSSIRQVYYILILLFIGGYMNSCSDATGENIVEKYPDGQAKCINYFRIVDEKEVVYKQTFFHKNGAKWKEGEISEGKKAGYWTSWYKDGIKWSEGDFSEGLSEGTFYSYAEDGSLMVESYYKSGKPSGTWKFYSNGEVTKEVIYDENGKKRERDVIENAPVK